jgi:hypothetical protein
MRKGLLAALVLMLLAIPVMAQDATPEATADAGAGQATAEATTDAAAGDGSASITVSDQLSLNGMVVIDSANSPAAGWVAIHVDMNGMPGPVVGIAPVVAGANESVSVMIDTLGATPSLFAQLHTDDNTVGAFEAERVPGADAPVGEPAPFSLTAVTAFDQMVMNNTAVVGSVISETGGWIVIHADDNGQPGAVLGQSPVAPGTSAGVPVQLIQDGVTPVLWPMLHIDDNTIGAYEFGTVEGADAPVVINEQVAALPVNNTAEITILTVAGVPLTSASVGSTEMSTFTVDSVVSAGPGWVDVHSDAAGHPGHSLGVAPVADGENTGIVVELNPMMNPNMPMPITPVVWPMLHVDDNQPGVYEYLVIPGADVPVVVNGAVVTYPVTVGDAAATDGSAPAADATAEMSGDMSEQGMEATAEATPAS